MKIGVFDSGVGGLSVANAIKQTLPGHTVILREDAEHLPYGTKTPDEIYGYIVPIFEELIALGCEIIVVACNTVSTTLIGRLRDRFPDTQLVAIEPMIKPASEKTRSGVIAVCATPTTLSSPRYNELKQTYASNLTVLEPDCSDWASMIERKQVDQKKIDERIQEVMDKGADVIVLGCTHYHWIEDEIALLAKDRAEVIQPESAIISRLRTLIESAQHS